MAIARYMLNILNFGGFGEAKQGTDRYIGSTQITTGFRSIGKTMASGFGYAPTTSGDFA